MRDKTTPLITFIESFLITKKLAPKSQRDYRRYLVDFDRFTGGVSLEEALDLDKAAQWVVTVHERGASAAQNGATYLKSFATWCSKNRYMGTPGRGGSVLIGLETPKAPEAHRQALTDQQVDAIWGTLELFPNRDRDRARAYMSLLIATGIRKNEARELALSDLHIDGIRSWIYVRAATSKGRRDRPVRLDASMIGNIERYIHDSRPTYTGPRNKPEPLFLTRDGRMFTEWGFSTWCDRIWDAIERDTGIHGFSHILRHTWATNFHRASAQTGTTFLDLKQQGGWRTDLMPQRYTHERPFDEFLAMPTHMGALRSVRKIEAS